MGQSETIERAPINVSAVELYQTVLQSKYMVAPNIYVWLQIPQENEMFKGKIRSFLARLVDHSSADQTPINNASIIIKNAHFYRMHMKRLILPELQREGLGSSELSDEQLSGWAQSTYVKFKTLWDQPDVTRSSRFDMAVPLYFAAITLFAFGQLDVLKYIFGCVKYTGVYSQYTRLQWIITALLPLPESVRKAYDAEPLNREAIIYDWLNENRQYLTWKEEKGMFILTQG